MRVASLLGLAFGPGDRPRGAVWLAYYALQRQEDGSWQARGCRLVHPARTISA